MKKKLQSGLPVFGTCAGLILLAGEVIGGSIHFGTMDDSSVFSGQHQGTYHSIELIFVIVRKLSQKCLHLFVITLEL